MSKFKNLIFIVEGTCDDKFKEMFYRSYQISVQEGFKIIKTDNLLDTFQVLYSLLKNQNRFDTDYYRSLVNSHTFVPDSTKKRKFINATISFKITLMNIEGFGSTLSDSFSKRFISLSDFFIEQQHYLQVNPNSNTETFIYIQKIPGIKHSTIKNFIQFFGIKH